jgi:hypothetical protein
MERQGNGMKHGAEHGLNEDCAVLRDGQANCIGLDLRYSMLCLHGVDLLSLIARRSQHDAYVK